jgi:hypothetical protein
MDIAKAALSGNWQSNFGINLVSFPFLKRLGDLRNELLPEGGATFFWNLWPYFLCKRSDAVQGQCRDNETCASSKTHRAFWELAKCLLSQNDAVLHLILHYKGSPSTTKQCTGAEFLQSTVPSEWLGGCTVTKHLMEGADLSEVALVLKDTVFCFATGDQVTSWFPGQNVPDGAESEQLTGRTIYSRQPSTTGFYPNRFTSPRLPAIPESFGPTRHTGYHLGVAEDGSSFEKAMSPQIPLLVLQTRTPDWPQGRHDRSELGLTRGADLVAACGDLLRVLPEERAEGRRGRSD